MNHLPRTRRPWRWNLRVAAVSLLVLLMGAAIAAPGAHGPNGEHLDGPAPGAASGSSAPRMEAKSETFELVAHLRSDELSMLINRYDTNEPVLNAKVEIESGMLKAVAKFHSDLGDYAVDDPALLKALRAPGDHAVVVTVLAGAETDLLDGTIKGTGTTQADDGHAHDDGLGNGSGIPLPAWIALALVLLGIVIYRLRPRRGNQAGMSSGGAK